MKTLTESNVLSKDYTGRYGLLSGFVIALLLPAGEARASLPAMSTADATSPPDIVEVDGPSHSTASEPGATALPRLPDPVPPLGLSTPQSGTEQRWLDTPAGPTDPTVHESPAQPTIATVSPSRVVNHATFKAIAPGPLPLAVPTAVPTRLGATPATKFFHSSNKSKLVNAAPLWQTFWTEQTDTGAPTTAGAATFPIMTPPSAQGADAIAEQPDSVGDPELGVIRLRDARQDPELGILRLRPVTPPQPRRPSLFLSTYVSASSSDNIFLIDDPNRGRLGDQFIRPGISLIAFPSLGPSTNLIASVEANAVRYQEFSNANYDELRLRVGVRHSFSRRMYAQLGWSHQFLFREGFRDRFFDNQGIELFVGRRDSLGPDLTLDTYYQSQIFFSDPAEFSDFVQSVGTYLNYRLNPQLDAGIGYQLTISDFTQASRHETYQRVTGQLRYSFSPAVRMSLFGGFSNGRSSAPNISFDDSFFGISVDATIELF